jgi:hypothetical protein
MDLSKHMLFQSVRLVGAVGIEPSGPLQTRKLFILRSDKSDKNGRNAEPRYTAGTLGISCERIVFTRFPSHGLKAYLASWAFQGPWMEARLCWSVHDSQISWVFEFRELPVFAQVIVDARLGQK